MKTTHLYVTLKEFTDNGGKLKRGRSIFREATVNMKYKPVYLVGKYLKFNETQKVHLVAVLGFKSCPLTEIIHLVKIKIKPIYK